MRALVSYRFFVPLILSTALGVFWADAVWWHKNSGVREWVESVPALDTLISYLHFPAMGLFYATSSLHIGPSGDAGWVMLIYCMIAQWVIIGSSIGFWLTRRHERRKHIA
jgi:hypothetical protein